MILIVVAAAAFWASGLGRGLTLQAIQAHHAQLRALIHAHPVLACASFVGVTAALTAACLPTTFLTMVAAGILFGGWVGAGAAIVAATLGATATYFAARMAGGGKLRRWLDANEGRLQQAVCHIDRSPFVCLLAMRMAPIIPFPAVSIAAGVMHAPVRTFIPATILGVAPAALLLGSLGAGLSGALGTDGKFDPSLVWQPYIVIPLAVLAVGSAVAAILTIRARGNEAPPATD